MRGRVVSSFFVVLGLSFCMWATPSAADTISAALAKGDSQFAEARYDSAATSYDKALQELERQGKWADAKFLLRSLSDRFYKENHRYQTRAGTTIGHSLYSKLSLHAGLFFERYSNMVAGRDSQSDEKLRTIGEEFLRRLDFRGSIAHETLARRFPNSPLAASSLLRAGTTVEAMSLHLPRETKLVRAKSLLRRLLEQYPTSQYVDDALYALARWEKEDYIRLRDLATRWRKREAELRNQPKDGAAKRELDALQIRFGSLREVESQAETAWQKGYDLLSQAISQHSTGDKTPNCLDERAYLHLLKNNREAARHDWSALKTKYPRFRSLAEGMLKKYSL